MSQNQTAKVEQVDLHKEKLDLISEILELARDPKASPTLASVKQELTEATSLLASKKAEAGEAQKVIVQSVSVRAALDKDKADHQKTVEDTYKNFETQRGAIEIALKNLEISKNAFHNEMAHRQTEITAAQNAADARHAQADMRDRSHDKDITEYNEAVNDLLARQTALAVAEKTHEENVAKFNARRKRLEDAARGD